MLDVAFLKEDQFICFPFFVFSSSQEYDGGRDRVGSFAPRRGLSDGGDWGRDRDRGVGDGLGDRDRDRGERGSA